MIDDSLIQLLKNPAILTEYQHIAGNLHASDKF